VLTQSASLDLPSYAPNFKGTLQIQILYRQHASTKHICKDGELPEVRTA